MPLQYRLNLKWGKIELAAPEHELGAFKHWVNQVTNLAYQKSGGEKRGGWPGNAPSWASEMFEIPPRSQGPY